jgi:hypothetical protein
MCILRANVDNMEFKTESVNQKLVYPIPVYVHTIEIEGFDEFAKLSLETRGMVNAQLISSEDMVIRANNKKVYADYVFIDRFYTMGDAAQETLMRQFSIDTLKRNLKTVLPTVGAQLAP